MIQVKVRSKKTLTSITRLISGLDRVVYSGMVKTANLGLRTARSKAKGSLKKQVNVQTRDKQVSLAASAPFAHFVEFGRGAITAKNGKVLRFEVGGQVLFRRSVGPAKAHPFMAPARVVMNNSSLVEASLDALVRSL